MPPRLQWNAEPLAQRLGALLSGFDVQVLAEVGSTSTQLLERARAGETSPLLLVAEAQTQGRGRQGKGWVSQPGASLTFSMALPLQPADWSGLSLAVGLALAEVLDPPAAAGGPARLALKWPNDLLLLDPDADPAGPPGRKLGGILVETVATAGATAVTGAFGAERTVVIGIGLNIRPLALAASPWGYAALQELDPTDTAPAVLARVAPAVLHTVLAFQRDGFAPLQPAYARRDALRGRALTTTLPQLPAGTADGVDADGALWLRRPDGARERLTSGEVSLRPAAATAGAAPC